MKIGATKISTKGQVVIPEEFRKWMNLKKGDTLIVEETSIENEAISRDMRAIVLYKLVSKAGVKK